MTADPGPQSRIHRSSRTPDRMLDVGDGQSIYWEASGNPHGKPAITLHGGPGLGQQPRDGDAGSTRRATGIVQLDQRGCGRSTRTPATWRPI